MYMEELGCYMTKKHLYKTLLPVGVLLAFSTLASAALIPTGSGTGAPENTTINPGMTETGTPIAASLIGGTNTNTIGGTTMIVQWTEEVYVDNTNCPGCLDFVITAKNVSAPLASGGDTINTISASGFDTHNSPLVWLGYETPANVTAAPLDVSRTPDGSTVGFYFAAQNPGSTLATMIIETEATTYLPGTLSFQDGVTVAVSAWGVSPEPNMACLLSVLAIGILGVAYRRKKNAAKNTEV